MCARQPGPVTWPQIRFLCVDGHVRRYVDPVLTLVRSRKYLLQFRASLNRRYWVPDDVGGPAHLEAETAEELIDRTPKEPEPADGFSEAGIREALRDVRDPEIGRDLVSLNMIQGIEIQGLNVTVGVSLSTAGCPLKHRITTDIKDRLIMIEGVEEV